MFGKVRLEMCSKLLWEINIRIGHVESVGEAMWATLTEFCRKRWAPLLLCDATLLR
jgi:hypothetical protein